MREFRGALWAEIIKLKYSGVLWLCTVGTFFTNLMMAIIPWQFPMVSEYLDIDPLASYTIAHVSGDFMCLVAPHRKSKPFLEIALCAPGGQGRDLSE